MVRATTRRTLLGAAVAAAGTGALTTGARAAGPPSAASVPPAAPVRTARLVDNRFWSSYTDWRCGDADGTRAVAGRRPGVVIGRAAGVTDYTDPHTGRTEPWEYGVWVSPEHRPTVPATEVIASWNAHTPAGTWLQTELSGTYSDGTATPWFVLGRWASGDGDIRRTSVDGQTDGRSSIWTDTFSVDDAASGLRLVAYRLRLTLYRRPGTRLTPTVRRLGAMASDVPDRFTVPATAPGPARELAVPRYSQNIHIGRYPEYDNGGEAWCSPTSAQMIIEYWGRKPTADELSWVNPAYDDPQVCHAARSTYDYQYQGCGNWPFNTAYAASYPGMNAVVTRLGSLTELERLVRAGIPVITSQSFRKEELTGAGYGTAGHLMTVVGFTPDGDVIANDPASDTNAAVRRVYLRREWENIWLRTKRYDANGKVRSGTGGVCYILWPVSPVPSQYRVLKSLGLL
ncbi:peptidase C39 family protein [Streptomyces qinzhouensis]|uniref:Peptidase C39 family protein n=1 Tax=Streptomyces qinzhouensis TaxID=2599401 RepID=A0A5B8IF56_9ACTN|nr:peptidase C39 family protein [Streptomyces qinzhouensis]QDY75819.1 peptidase C39 family protein [Streptomyces qinzhouensis]